MGSRERVVCGARFASGGAGRLHFGLQRDDGFRGEVALEAGRQARQRGHGSREVRAGPVGLARLQARLGAAHQGIGGIRAEAQREGIGHRSAGGITLRQPHLGHGQVTAAKVHATRFASQRGQTLQGTVRVAAVQQEPGRSHAGFKQQLRLFGLFGEAFPGGEVRRSHIGAAC